MIKILFVCHGNICRSAMAEYILKDRLRKLGKTDLYRIESAATSDEEIGNPVYPPAKRMLERHGIECGEHHARQMTKYDYDLFDVILCMDRNNIRNLYRITGGDPQRKVSLLLDHTDRKGQEIADPWYTGDFDSTWRDLDEACKCLENEFFIQDPPSNTCT